MFDPRLLRTLPGFAEPVLAVSLDTNPANPCNLGRPSSAAAWVKPHTREHATRLTDADPKLIKDQAQRIGAYRGCHPAQAKGLIFFAGPRAGRSSGRKSRWRIYWEQPSLGQLMWILDEHQPPDVLVVDRRGARFFRCWLGEIEERRQDPSFLTGLPSPYLLRIDSGLAGSTVMWEALLARFAQATPESVMARMVPAAWVNDSFEAARQRQYRRALLLSTVIELILPVALELPLALLGHSAEHSRRGGRGRGGGALALGGRSGRLAGLSRAGSRFMRRAQPSVPQTNQGCTN